MSNYPTVLSRAAVENMFGRFAWKANGDQFITILGDWVERNITTVYIPELDGVPTFGGKFGGRVRWHKDGAEQLQRAFQEVGKAGLAGDIIMWGGSFVPRRMRGSSNLSRHSWGTAFDINPAQNGFGREIAPAGSFGSVVRVAPIFEKHGFAWGGRWSPRNRDGMHFEIARKIDYSSLQPAPDAQLVINDEWQKAIPLTLKDGVSFASLSALAKATGDPAVNDEREVPVAQYLNSRGYTVTWNNEQKKIYAYK